MDDKEDLYTKTVLSNIDREIRLSFTGKQLKAIKKALQSSKSSPARDRVDIRGVINLYFQRYYFVFLLGRDKRKPTQSHEFERRKKTSVFVGRIIIVIALIPLVLILLFA